MINVKQLYMYAKWLEDSQRFLLYATYDTKNLLPIDMWSRHLFIWHKQSFYGSFLNTDEKGVLIEAYELCTLLAKRQFSSLQRIEWAGEAKWLYEQAPAILEQLEKQKFAPDFQAWQRGEHEWILYEIETSSFPYLKKALSAIVQTFVQQHEELSEKWEQIQASPLMQTTGQPLPLTEEIWLEKIGWVTDGAPFTIHLRLSEPVADDDAWLLETVLIDNMDSTKEFRYPNSMLPAEMEAWADKVVDEQKMWFDIVPWLKDKQTLTEEEAWKFLTEASVTLAEFGVHVQLPAWWEELKKNRPQIKMAVNQTFGKTPSMLGMDTIVQFDWKLATNDIELEEAEFMQLVEENRKIIRVKGKWITLDPSFLQYLKKMKQKIEKDGLQLRDILQHQIGMDDNETNHAEEDVFRELKIELNDNLKEMIGSLKRIKSIPEVTISEKLQATLRPYQKQGVEWLLFLRQFHFGACLADDMGLGKTIQIITYLLHVKEAETLTKPALIICPTSVLGNWQKELERFAPSLSVYVHYGANRAKEDAFIEKGTQADVILTTYTVASLDEQELHSIQWSAIVIDEAQNIKNAHTKQSQVIRKLKAAHHIALTGTPIENRLSELWSIFDFINSGYLGSIRNFQQKFVAPIEGEKDAARLQELQRLIQPFLLRRTKKDEEVSLNLPEKQEQKAYCPLTVEQASLYEQVVQDTFRQLQEVSGMKRRGLILSMLTKLKQICNHPALYLREAAPTTGLVERSYKSKKLIELVEQIVAVDESCLIFTQYVGMGYFIQQMIKDTLGKEAFFLQGSLSKQARDNMVEQFQNKEKQILILSLRAGGTGLNLTAANHVIHYDRWWNPAVENQATDRAYRIGQKRFVHVHKLIATGTLEEKIDEMIEQKQQLSNDVITGESWITELKDEELHELFALNVM